MKKICLIAALALGSLLACSNLATAQDTNSSGSAPKKDKGGKRGMFSPEQQLEKMSADLKLTDDQKPKVKAVLEDGAKQRQALRDLPQDEARTKGRALREDQDKKLKEILTPDQWDKYEKMMQDMRKKGGEKKKKNSE